jgi:antitoxin YefM
MIATKQMDVRANIKKYFDMAFNGEPVIVSRKENKNVVIISEAEYNELAKVKRNAEYLAKLDKSFKQFEEGKTISFSMEELREMESDDWKPTQKVLDWMKRMEQENE